MKTVIPKAPQTNVTVKHMKSKLVRNLVNSALTSFEAKPPALKFTISNCPLSVRMSPFGRQSRHSNPLGGRSTWGVTKLQLLLFRSSCRPDSTLCSLSELLTSRCVLCVLWPPRVSRADHCCHFRIVVTGEKKHLCWKPSRYTGNCVVRLSD